MSRVDEILRKVAEHYDLPPETLAGPGRRSARVSRARHVSVWLLRELTHWSFSDLGQMIGRDHSTLVHSYQVVSENPELLAEAGELKAMF